MSLTSTAGSIAINNSIDSTIGDLTINAANDVTISQPIVSLNDGNDVTIAAGNDINVNSQINGLDGTPGGSVRLTTVNGNVNVNDHIVTNDGAITISAGENAAGTIIQKADGLDTYGAPLTKQIRAGRAEISLTSGTDLNMGSLVTTGPLNVTSGRDINIEVPIYETTGTATLIAARDININQAAVNTTSGADLFMGAGGNIAVNANVGPWDRSTLNSGELGISRNAVPGGSISLSADGNIYVKNAIASYKGTLADRDAARISLSGGSAGQPTGTVIIDDDIKVMSDKGAIQVTAYGDLDNGSFPSNVNEIPGTGYFTTGPLSLTSTHGNLTINRTIPETTGKVTLSAGNKIEIYERVYSNNADISLTAGAGGIWMSPVTDSDTAVLSDIDAREGNLTLVAQGDIYPSVLRTCSNLMVKSTSGSIIGGTVMPSRGGSGRDFPAAIELAGSTGISHFATQLSSNIKAISDKGSVEDLAVYAPAFLEVLAHDNIIMSGLLGNAGLYAGGNIENKNYVYDSVLGTYVYKPYLIVGNQIIQKAGGNITAGSGSVPALLIETSSSTTADFSYIGSSLNLSAGTNPFTGFSDTYRIAGVSVAPLKALAPAGPGDITVPAGIWLEGEGGLTASAAHDIDMNTIHVSYRLMKSSDETYESLAQDPKQYSQPLSLTSGRNMNLPERIETIGPVTLISQNGNITIGQTIGAHVADQTPEAHVWNPYDKGVYSLTVTANNGNITMQEARAESNISIQAPHGSVTHGAGIESVSGTSTVKGSSYNVPISPVEVARLPVPMPVIPVASPGPMIAGPAAPPLAGALPPNAPTTPPVQGGTEPAGPGSSSGEPGQPSVTSPELLGTGSAATVEQVDAEQAAGSASLSEIIPVEDEDDEDYAEEGENRKEETASESGAERGIKVGDKDKDNVILDFPGGRGISQTTVTNEIYPTSTIPSTPYSEARFPRTR